MKLLYLPHKYSQQRQREKAVWIYPIHLAMEAEWHRQNGDLVYWGEASNAHDYDRIITEPEGVPFLDLPIADRIFTEAKDRKYQRNGNFKYRPGTYILVSSGCWYRKCTFCVESHKDKPTTRPISSVIQELVYLQHLGFKEVFDDSGTFPVGNWLTMFCIDKIHSSAESIPISCNMRIGADVDYRFMKKAKFRMLLYGLESSNQQTLDRMKKGIRYEAIVPELRRASEAGLEPHVAFIFGYPWESAEEEKKSLSFLHFLLRKGYAKTAQASLYDVPGEHPIDRGSVKKLYDIGYHPEFWINKAKDLRRWDDIVYLFRGIKKGLFRD